MMPSALSKRIVVTCIALSVGLGLPASADGPSVATNDLGEHGVNSRLVFPLTSADPSPTFVFDQLDGALPVLRLSFYVTPATAFDVAEADVCFRLNNPWVDRSSDDANVTESASDSCASQTNGWVKVPRVAPAGPLNEPQVSPGVSRYLARVYDYGDLPFLSLIDASGDFFTLHYQAVITALSPQTRYEYRIVRGSQKLANRVVIETPRAKLHLDSTSSAPTSFDFAAIADLRIRAFDDKGEQTKVRDQLTDSILNRNTRFVILPGDVSNASGTSMQYWDTYLQFYQAIQRMVPFFAVQGNHDLFARTYLLNSYNDGYHFFHMLPAPSNPIAEGTLHRDAVVGGYTTGYRSYYSFDWGIAHFIAIDNTSQTEGTYNFEDANACNSAACSKQYIWISNDLDKAQWAQWRIAYFHAHIGEGPLLALLRSKNVDLIINGHDEAPALRFNDSDPPAVTLPSGGARGQYFGNASANDSCITDHSKRYGFGRFRVSATSLTGELISSTGLLSANFSISKPMGALRANPPIASSWIDTTGCVGIKVANSQVTGPQSVGTLSAITRAADGVPVVFTAATDGQVYRAKNSDGNDPTWANVAGPWVSRISVMADGTIFGIGSNLAVYRKREGQGWEQVTGGSVTRLSVAQASPGATPVIYGIGTAGDLWRALPSSNWVRVAAVYATDLSVTPDGKIFWISSDGAVNLTIEGQGSRRVTTPWVSTITVTAGGTIFGLGGDRAVWKADPPTYGWAKVTDTSGAYWNDFRNIAVTPNGTLFGVATSDNSVWRR